MIQLRALGVLDLRNSEGEQLRQVLAQPKRAALLTYLVLATPRGSHPRDKLLALSSHAAAGWGAMTFGGWIAQPVTPP